MPIKAYQDFSAFKLFLVDVGLLGAMSDLDVKAILEGNNIFKEFKGALTEQFVLQQLNDLDEIIPFYWSAEKSTGEIDFIIQKFNSVIPIEVKASENLQAKSLKNFCLRYKTEYAVRTSMSNYRKENWMVNIPLYMINFVIEILKDNF
jgi:predicted AAA+ superfamily ATPase